MCAKIAYVFWNKRNTVSSIFSLSCEKKVKETGILIDKPKREMPKTLRTSEYIAAVAESVCGASSTSILRRSQQLNISETSLRRILHKDLGMTPDKVQLVQELKPIDHPMRFRFVKWACNWLTEDLFRLSSFWSWRLCKQEKLSHLARIHCGFWSKGIIGPFFFENERGEAVTVNGDRYRAILNEILFTKIEE